MLGTVNVKLTSCYFGGVSGIVAQFKLAGESLRILPECGQGVKFRCRPMPGADCP